MSDIDLTVCMSYIFYVITFNGRMGITTDNSLSYLIPPPGMFLNIHSTNKEEEPHQQGIRNTPGVNRLHKDCHISTVWWRIEASRKVLENVSVSHFHCLPQRSASKYARNTRSFAKLYDPFLSPPKQRTTIPRYLAGFNKNFHISNGMKADWGVWGDSFEKASVSSFRCLLRSLVSGYVRNVWSSQKFDTFYLLPNIGPITSSIRKNDTDFTNHQKKGKTTTSGLRVSGLTQIKKILIWLMACGSIMVYALKGLKCHTNLIFPDGTSMLSPLLNYNISLKNKQKRTMGNNPCSKKGLYCKKKLLHFKKEVQFLRHLPSNHHQRKMGGWKGILVDPPRGYFKRVTNIS